MPNFTDSRITESSGLAISHTYYPVLWTLNDENRKPHVFGVHGGTGKTVATFSLKNALISDPEAISLDNHNRLWVGDLGDNDSNRAYVRLFVLGEPGGSGNHGDLDATGYRLSYPGGPRNAESFFVHPSTGVGYVISKESSSKLYRLPSILRVPPSVNTLTLVNSSMGANVSDASITPDGRFLLTRRKDQNTTVYVHRTSDWAQIDTITVPSQTKPEGISVDWSQGGFWISSEGQYSRFYHESMPSAYQKVVTPPPAAPVVSPTPCG